MSLESAKKYIKEVATFDTPTVDSEVAILDTSKLDNALYKASLPLWNYTDKGDFPEVGNIVVAVVEWSKSKKRVPCVLRFVNEDDCNWRTADDNSELSNSCKMVSDASVLITANERI